MLMMYFQKHVKDSQGHCSFVSGSQGKVAVSGFYLCYIYVCMCVYVHFWNGAEIFRMNGAQITNASNRIKGNIIKWSKTEIHY
jgi:hypothetical protein